jgi:adenylosuccinate synthase
MSATVVVGGFFGDEGKGKIVAHLALTDRPRIAVRGGVGPNAGHTVLHAGRTFRLRMLPSAVVAPESRLLVGAGVAVNPEVLLEEVSAYDAAQRVGVDRQCTIIEPKHLTTDQGGHLQARIGTTGTGTGPANADRALRTARLAQSEPALQPYLTDVATEVHDTLAQGAHILVEGTQGTFLSLYHGTYPYVTSKEVTASAICADVGLGPRRVHEVVVVFKAYVTRVGAGELPGELSPEEVTQRGWSERGTVTGRLRRAAPFDFGLAQRAVRLNSASQLAITKLDVLFPDAANHTRWDELPAAARGFVKQVETATGVPVVLLGTGADTAAIIDRRQKTFHGPPS